MQNQSELISCGNKNLDSLLNYLLGQAKKKLNHVEYEVRVPSDLCISAFDLNVILGNLTENAIEAAEQTEDKWMSVNIYYEKGMFSMEISSRTTMMLRTPPAVSVWLKAKRRERA